MTTPTFLKNLLTIVGKRHVHSRKAATAFYRSGFREGGGNVLAVVCPGSLLEQWKILQACVADNKIVIMQAANTGLTGGSTPNGDEYDRDVVVINTLRIDGIVVLDSGDQVVGFSGATLHALEEVLAPLYRVPHSVIGSSCLGAYCRWCGE